VLFRSATWLGATLLVTVRLVADWPLPDNHIYLLAYFCAAVFIALSIPESSNALARSCRLLLGLAFALAVLWKAFLSTDYLDGRFFRVTLLTDARFEETVRLVGLDAQALRENREYLLPLPEGAELLHPRRLHEPRGVRVLAGWATWGTLVLEAIVALAFLWPGVGAGLQSLRHASLLTFCAVIYALAPVAGFGWLLVAMGLSTCGPGEHRARGLYAALFLVIVLYSEVPWAAMGLDLITPFTG